MNPLFNHVSSEIFLSWVLASSEGGTDVLIQFLYLKKEKKSERTEYIQWSTELSSRIMLELGKKKKKKSYVLEVTCGWVVHFALCYNYILLSAGKVSQLSASPEQKSAWCHFSSLPRCHCQLSFLLGSWLNFVSSDSLHHPETNWTSFVHYLLHRMGKCGLYSELS